MLQKNKLKEMSWSDGIINFYFDDLNVILDSKP